MRYANFLLDFCIKYGFIRDYSLLFIIFVPQIYLAMQNIKTRQSALLEIVGKETIFSQEELIAKMSARGIVTTQATLSRDLKALHIRKFPGEGYRLTQTVTREGSYLPGPAPHRLHTGHPCRRRHRAPGAAPGLHAQAGAGRPRTVHARHLQPGHLPFFREIKKPERVSRLAPGATDHINILV